MSDPVEPPPLFDEDDSRKDEEDIFASAVQSPISGDVTPEAEPVNSADSHPLLHEEKGDSSKEAQEDVSIRNEQEEERPTSPHRPLIQPFSDEPIICDAPLNNATIDNRNNIDQVREDSDGGGVTLDDANGEGISNSKQGLDVSSTIPVTHIYNLSLECGSNTCHVKDNNSLANTNNSSPKPHILSDVDTTEVLLDDTAQEISLNDDDDDGDLFKSVSAPRLHPNQESSVPKPAEILPPVGASLSHSQPVSFPTSYSTASAASHSPISPIISPITTPTPTMRTSLEQMEKDGGDSFIEIHISDPQKIGDGMGSYMAYKVTTKTNIQYFRKKHWSVTRRFSDFLGLHSKLVEKHLHSGVIIPPAPEKAAIATTKIKLASDKNSDSSSVEFIERRRAALERYMNRTAAHPKLRSDPDFREFIELDTDLPKATSTSAMSSAGVLRLFNKVGETVNKMTFKMDESDQWFEEKTQQVENLDNQLRKLHASLEGLVGYRRELANSTGNFSKSAAVLSSVEEHTALSRALHQLSEAMERIHTIHHSQADADFFHLSETTKDYVNIIGAVKEVFHERVKTFQTWQHAQVTLAKKRENKAKMELTGRIDKVEQANEEVKEWETKVERSQEEFERISRAIKAEMEQFDVIRVIDFKDMLVKYLEALIASQLQIVKVWESFLPEAKAIA